MSFKHLVFVLPALLAAASCAKGSAIDGGGAGGSSAATESTTGSNNMTTGSSQMTTSSQSGTSTGTGSSTSGCGNMCDMDNDGVLDGMDTCANTPMGEAVNGVGCGDSQVMPKLHPMFPPYGLTWTPTGDPGRAGGLTWTYTGIDKGDLFHVYWVFCDDPTTPCGVSLDGPIDPATEGWQFSADSNLPGGKLVFLNQTHIILADSSTPTLTGRLTVTIVDDASMPLPFATLTNLGIVGQAGKFAAEIPGAGYTVTMIIEIQDGMGNWVPYLDYYDAAATVDGGPPATISIGGSFYDE